MFSLRLYFREKIFIDSLPYKCDKFIYLFIYSKSTSRVEEH